MRILTIILSLACVSAFAGIPEEVAELKKKAEQGDAHSQCILGLSYAQGRKIDGVIKDDVEAVRWFRMAAEQGNSKGQYFLASFYESGWGVEKNLIEAYAYYKLSEIYGTHNSDIAKKITEVEKLLTVSQLEAGQKRYEEIHVKTEERVFEKKFRYLRIKAEEGDADIEEELAYCYLKQKDAKQAAKWFLKSAEHGNHDAQWTIGFMYARGVGVERDGIEGYAFMLLSGRNDFIGLHHRDQAETELSKSQLETGIKRSKELKVEIEAKIAAKGDKK
jgi:TPR repeat protein